MPIAPAFNYTDTVSEAPPIDWRIEDIIGPGKPLDFTRPFLPESFARADSLGFLTAPERIVLNQIRAYGYLHVFGLFEAVILPFVLDHIRPSLARLPHRTQAMLQFANEEAKHIELFGRFRQAFVAGFGSQCRTVGPAEELAEAILAHDALGVGLLILHFEWMTQRHYLDSVKDQRDLDPQFKSLLHYHWLEEAQHAKLDTLMVAEIAAGLTPAEVEWGIEDYLAIIRMLDDRLSEQADFDLESLTAATGRAFTPAQGATFRNQQHQANRWTFLGSGISHPSFLETIDQLSEGARARLEEISLTLL